MVKILPVVLLGAAAFLVVRGGTSKKEEQMASSIGGGGGSGGAIIEFLPVPSALPLAPETASAPETKKEAAIIPNITIIESPAVIQTPPAETKKEKAVSGGQSVATEEDLARAASISPTTGRKKGVLPAPINPFKKQQFVGGAVGAIARRFVNPFRGGFKQAGGLLGRIF